MMHRTKIGATIGPASADSAIIENMIKAGMSFARLNFSHGTHAEHAALIKAIRAAAKNTDTSVLVMQDLQGPKMRLGVLPAAGIELIAGNTIAFDTAQTDYNDNALPVTFMGLEKHLRVGERILIDDGHMEVMITALQGSVITATVISGGRAISHKGLNFPDSTLLGIPALSEKDKDDIAFGVAEGVDSISLSFAKTAADITELKAVIASVQQKIGTNQKIMIVGKIERPEAVKNLLEIIEQVDAVMVARGDLGLEMPGAMLPITQKNIIKSANQAQKPVIVATQLLDSMQHSRRPTRAETTDVANAVIDGADALLLTNETAVGDFPVITVETMRDIIVETEKSAYDDEVHPASEHSSSLFSN